MKASVGSIAVAGLGVFVMLMGLSLVVSPAWLIGLVDWEAQQGAYVAGAIRIVAGLILILGASASRYPTGFRVLGAVVLIAGIGLLFVPLDLWAGLIGWVFQKSALLRMGGVLAIPLGFFLVRASRQPQDVGSST